MSARTDRITVSLAPGEGEDVLNRRVRQRARGAAWRTFHVTRHSLDARRDRVRFVIQVAPGPAPVPRGVTALLDAETLAAVRSDGSAEDRPLIVGTGPAGLFAGLLLAYAGCRPLLIEQGRPVEARQRDVAAFWAGRRLDPDSNVQFGEGGAGTFSDGKLTTGIRDPRVRAVLEELVLHGAPEEILTLARPHVGTDRLPAVVTAIRSRIEELGGSYRFGCRMTDLSTGSGRVYGVRTADGQELRAGQVVLAIGHSARRSQRMLLDRGVGMEPKAFSVGIRVEHEQRWIDRIQYGKDAGHEALPPAEYRLVRHLPSGRSVYTFCMCPGGTVVAAASEPGHLVTNGMSSFARDGTVANSALLVTVRPDEFSEPGPLGGVALQRQLEQTAFTAGGGNWNAPASPLAALLDDTRSFGQSDLSLATYRPGVTPVRPDAYLPEFVRAALREALPLLDRTLPGFVSDGIATGVESRSSSPVRILRDSTGQASLSGLFPCGEGAGYAGGIVSAAVDGLRAAAAVLAVRTGRAGL